MNKAITCLYAMLLLDVNLDLIFEHNAISYIDLADSGRWGESPKILMYEKIQYFKKQLQKKIPFRP